MSPFSFRVPEMCQPWELLAAKESLGNDSLHSEYGSTQTIKGDYKYFLDWREIKRVVPRQELRNVSAVKLDVGMRENRLLPSLSVSMKFAVIALDDYSLMDIYILGKFAGSHIADAGRRAAKQPWSKPLAT